jgi:hypothetical protein
MEPVRVRPKVADRYRDPRVAWQKLFPFVLLSSAGTFVAEYHSIHSGNFVFFNNWGESYIYFSVFVLQAIFYGLAGWLSSHLVNPNKLALINIVSGVAAGLLLLSGVWILLFQKTWLVVATLSWWAAWPFFQLRVWGAVAFSSSKRLMSYAVGVILMFSFVIAGILIAILEWMPGLSHATIVGVMTLVAGFMSFGTSGIFQGMVVASNQERKTVSFSWLLVSGVMGLVTGMLWGYTEIFLPHIFKGNTGKALITDISNLYPLILAATGIFAWPGGKMLSYRDSDVGFVLSSTVSILLIVVLSNAGEDTLIMSLAAAFYIPVFSLTYIAALASAVKRMNLFRIQEGWKIMGSVWLSLMLGRALVVFFQ